jgi:hypothetical protein
VPGEEFVGGPEAFGLLPGTLGDYGLAGLRGNAPQGAFGAISYVRATSLGLTGFGENGIVLFSALGRSVRDPFLAFLAQNSLQPLAIGGWENDPVFGGNGPRLLDTLCATCVFAAVAGTDALQDIQASGNGIVGRRTLALGETFYLQSAVPEPAGWAMLIIGFGLTGAVLRRGRACAVQRG